MIIWFFVYVELADQNSLASIWNLLCLLKYLFYSMLVPMEPEEGTESFGATVLGGCRTLVLCTGNQTQVIWKSSKWFLAAKSYPHTLCGTLQTVTVHSYTVFSIYVDPTVASSNTHTNKGEMDEP